MNELAAWNYDGTTVRTIMIDDEPWFVGQDVCNALGISNSRDAISRLDDDEKDVALTDTLGGTQSMSVINEFGLYTLILTSRKPEAKKFKRWITHEVIPSIRKYGVYATPEKLTELLSKPETIVTMLKALTDEMQKRIDCEKERTTGLEDPVEKILRIASSFPVDTDEEATLSTRAIAKEYGREAKWLNTVLEVKKVQYRDSDGVWRLSDALQKYGFRQIASFSRRGMFAPVPTSFWTETGHQFIKAILEADGIFPLPLTDKEE